MRRLAPFIMMFAVLCGVSNALLLLYGRYGIYLVWIVMQDDSYVNFTLHCLVI